MAGHENEPEVTILAEGLTFPEGPVWHADGRVALVEIDAGTLTCVHPDGTKQVIAEVGGGPNGLAVGPDGAYYICNNGGFEWHQRAGYRLPVLPSKDYRGGRIERVDPATGTCTVLYDRCGERRLSAPNDLVFDDHGGFYFTDTGKARANDRDHGGVYYATADGSRIVEVAFPVLTANGIALSPDGRVLHVAEMEPGRVWSFDILEPGVVRKLDFPAPGHGGRLLHGLGGFQRLDSMAVDGEGNVCVGTLPVGVISVISPGGELLRQVKMPDPYPTNLCFGGEGLRTAFVTLSLTGRLGAFEWPTAGLPLACAN